MKGVGLLEALGLVHGASGHVEEVPRLQDHIEDAGAEVRLGEVTGGEPGGAHMSMCWVGVLREGVYDKDFYLARKRQLAIMPHFGVMLCACVRARARVRVCKPWEDVFRGGGGIEFPALLALKLEDEGINVIPASWGTEIHHALRV